MDSLLVIATFFGPAIAVWIAFKLGIKEYEQKLKVDGISVAVSYRSMIFSINKDLRETLEYFDVYLLASLPPKSIYDFRKEDWFSEHNALSTRLGNLYYVDKEDGKGRKANREITEFFNEFKYVRELYAFITLLSKAKAIGNGAEWVKEINDLLTNQYTLLEKRLKELIDIGENALGTLDKLISQDQRDDKCDRPTDTKGT